MPRRAIQLSYLTAHTAQASVYLRAFVGAFAGCKGNYASLNTTNGNPQPGDTALCYFAGPQRLVNG